MNKLLCILLFSAALATPVAGQLFPYDRTAEEMPAGDLVAWYFVSEHTEHFGDDSVTVETYADTVEEIPAPVGWAIKTRCTGTLFLGQRRLAGPFSTLLTTRARTTLLVHRERMYLEIDLELLPDGSISKYVHRFGDWPPKGSKRS